MCVFALALNHILIVRLHWLVFLSQFEVCDDLIPKGICSVWLDLRGSSIHFLLHEEG